MEPTSFHRYVTMREMDSFVAEIAMKYKDDRRMNLDSAISELKEILSTTFPRHVVIMITLIII